MTTHTSVAHPHGASTPPGSISWSPERRERRADLIEVAPGLYTLVDERVLVQLYEQTQALASEAFELACSFIRLGAVLLAWQEGCVA